MNKAVTISVGFLHDFAAGCWAAAMLAVWRLDRLHLQPEVHALQKEFFFIGLASIVIVMAAGYGRTFTYISNVYGEDAEKERRRLLIIKHVILGVVFGLGTWWQYAMVYR